MRTGGRILVDQLVYRGTHQVFCVPGESYLEILNALYDVPTKVKVYNARHEAGAANMAEAYGKLTGTPGVALVTRGPGACHASIGVHIAYQDSTPLILIVGQVSQSTRDREAFQEIDYQSMFGSISKWCAQIESVERIPEYMAKAFNIAGSGRPGPVVLSIPENILSQTSGSSDFPLTHYFQAAPEIDAEASVDALLKESIRPMILVGGTSWNKKARANVLNFAEKYSIPVISGFRRQDILDNNSSAFCGTLGTSVSPTLLERVAEADLLLVIGSRLGEMTTQGYKIFNAHISKKLIHVHVDPNELGAVHATDLGIVSTVENFSRLLLNLKLRMNADWDEWCKMLHFEYLSDLIPPPCSGALDLGKVLEYINQCLPVDSIITLDAGNHTGWPQRYLRYGSMRRQIGSTCGAMGYAVPAAVAAALTYKERQVICFVGDGGFLMSGMELTTAVQHKLPLIIIIFNNSSYGTIRMHQEREHPGRVIATNLENPSFKDMAVAMGAHGELVETTNSFIDAFDRCLLQKKPSLIELKTEINQISTRYSLNNLKNK